jgi:alpha-tubulin suppressor-like RCC1 family protein
MSPEQVDGQELDGRSDLYSLGVLGWEMLTGCQPWEGESLYSVIFKQKNEELPPIREFRPDVPPDLLRAVEGAMRKRPEDRWRTAGHFLRALDAGFPRDASAVPSPTSEADTPSVLEPEPRASQPGVPPTAGVARTPEIAPEPKDAPEPKVAPAPETASTAKDEGPDPEPASELNSELDPGLAHAAESDPHPLTSPGPVEEAGAASGSSAADAGAAPRGPVALPPLRSPPPWARSDDDATPEGTDDLALAMAASSARAASSVGKEADADEAWTLPGGARVSPGVLLVVVGGVISLVLLSVGATLLIPSSTEDDRDGTGSGAWPGASSATIEGSMGAAGGLPGAGAWDWTVETGQEGTAADLGTPEGAPGFDPALVGVRRIAMLGGNAQSGPPDEPLADPLVLRVVDGNGRPVADARVSFEVLDGRGGVAPLATTSRADGIVVARWTLGGTGPQRVVARVAGGGNPEAVFSAAALGSAVPPSAASQSSARRDEDTRSPGPVSLPVRPAVQTGGQHTCALRPNGELICWGGNARGQLGDGSGRRVLLPLLAIQAGRYADLASGVNHGCGLTTTGDAFCWGANDQGQLGGGGGSSPTPRAVPGSASFTRITAGLAHTCALDADGAAFCWGRNLNGQLGDGSTERRQAPVRVQTDRRFTSIVAGWRHTCALDGAGQAACWGDGASGQLGTGTAVSSTTPRGVTGGHVFRMLAAGGAHTCGLRSDGRILCWGSNAFGQLGTGHGRSAAGPTPIASAAGFATVVAGADHGCALAQGGEVVCWGRNSHGQLGDGTNSDRGVPAPVLGNHRFTSLDATGSHNCGRNSAGVLLCWGRNDEGQLGDGTRQDRSQPVAAGGGN